MNDSPDSGTLARKSASVLPIHKTPKQLLDQISFSYLLFDPEAQRLERANLAPFAELLSDILATSGSASAVQQGILNGLQMEHIAVNFDDSAISEPYNIIVSNHPCNAYVDGALLVASIERLGLSPTIFCARNLDFSGTEEFLPIEMPIISGRDSRKQSDINKFNSNSMKRATEYLLAGRGIGIFPSAGYFDYSKPENRLVESSFVRLAPFLYETRRLEPEVICIKHVYDIPAWWVELYQKDIEKFFAMQWKAALTIGPQKVNSYLISRKNISRNAEFGSLANLCEEIRSEFNNFQ